MKPANPTWPARRTTLAKKKLARPSGTARPQGLMPFPDGVAPVRSFDRTVTNEAIEESFLGLVRPAPGSMPVRVSLAARVEVAPGTKESPVHIEY